MKQFIVIAATLFSWSVQAQSVKLPQPSPTQTVKQNFGLGNIELSYSRPALKGRTAFKEASELAPIGKIWRTGANGATTLKFSDDVTVNNVLLKAGKYGLLSIPGKKSFELIITKDTTVSSPNDYKAANDVVHFTAPINKAGDRAELFTIQFANITYETLDLELTWGNVSLTLPISTNIKDRVKADVLKSIDSDKPAYSAIANYYFDIEKNYTKALEYVTKGISAIKPSYAGYFLKAKIEKELGDKVSAKADAEKAVELATAAANDDVVRSAKAFLGKL